VFHKKVLVEVIQISPLKEDRILTFKLLGLAGKKRKFALVAKRK